MNEDKKKSKERIKKENEKIEVYIVRNMISRE